MQFNYPVCSISIFYFELLYADHTEPEGVLLAINNFKEMHESKNYFYKN